MITGGVASFNSDPTSASSMTVQAAEIGANGVGTGVLDNILVPSLGGITLTKSGAGLRYAPTGNLNVSGKISMNNGAVELLPTGNFVNDYSGNPFTASSVKILTQDLFTYPRSAAVPGLVPVFGATRAADLGANQIGVAKTLLEGSAGPYITEFTTGTGQPYVMATQNAVPPVMVPSLIVGAGAFPGRVTYSSEEIEMMTPEERAGYESQQRQQAARVILEQSSSQDELPAEGKIPQAKATPNDEVPTAQVFLQGKPLAGRADRDAKGSTQLLRIRPNKAFVLRSGNAVDRILEDERMAAEVQVGSLPVAGNR